MDPKKQSTWLLDDLVGSLGKPDASNKFPLYIDEKEVDDDMHMPQPDDDVRLKATFKGDLCCQLTRWSDHCLCLYFYQS